MKNGDFKLNDGERLDAWLQRQDNSCFPTFSLEMGQKPYPERYLEFAKILLPIHNSVEKGAMANDVIKWMQETVANINKKTDINKKEQLLHQLFDADPIVYLNNHGKGHVDKVIEKVSEMLRLFEDGHLTPYEGFFLLCAIQAHDTGNVFGRENHEKRCKDILNSKTKLYVDSFERTFIEKLALVHGGSYDGDRDTISYLSESKTLYERKIRKRLLAALLRFGDELADDSSRADIEGLENGTISEGSIIYHRYSQSLHTVKIEKDSETKRIILHLSYELDSDIATKTFIKNGKDKYLLDEIYDRTLKMERERRYCMRYLRPYFSLDAIRVEIVIQCTKNLLKSDQIKYTLKENGYPSDPVSGSIKEVVHDLKTGEEEKLYLMSEWGL